MEKIFLSKNQNQYEAFIKEKQLKDLNDHNNSIKEQQKQNKKVGKKIKTKSTKVASPIEELTTKNLHHSVNYEITQDSGGKHLKRIY